MQVANCKLKNEEDDWKTLFYAYERSVILVIKCLQRCDPLAFVGYFFLRNFPHGLTPASLMNSCVLGRKFMSVLEELFKKIFCTLLHNSI